MSQRNYRPEIDGLRAISVIGVLLFHIGLGFPGGFVGVDVFFVISGYLITGILLRELGDGRFSLANFWVRRIRRILPASAVMVLVTLAAGYAILTPLAYMDLAETAIAQALVVSNFIFARQDGYFTESADFTPLLHTWSLAVEEQFYILFPLLLLAAWRGPRRWLLIGALAIGCASFAWSCYSVSADPKASFFLLPSRAWELMVGALLAAVPRRQTSPRWGEVASAVGLAMILAAMFAYDRHTPFPGIAAALPVAGAGLVILGNQGTLTLSGRLLALRPMVFVGLISYSLYLWHWPLMVFAKHLVSELDLAWKVALIGASFLFATVSWRFVETPFRRQGGPLQTAPAAFTFAAVSMGIVIACGSVIWQGEGLAKRVDDDLRLLLEDIDWRGDEYVAEDGEPVPIGAAEGDLSFVLWGDSHGMAMAHTVDQVASANDRRGAAILSAGVPPVTGLWFAGMDDGERQELLDRNRQVLARIIDMGVSDLILAGRWIARCDGYNDAEMVDREPSYRQAPMVIDGPGQTPSPEVSSAALARQLESMLVALQEAGIRVWLIRQVPETNHRDTAKQVAMLKRFPGGNRLEAFTTTRAQHLERRRSSDAVFAGLPQGLVEIVDPSDQFFPAGQRLNIYGERSYYRDDDHLTRPGAERYLAPVFEAIFRRQHPAQVR